MAEEKKQAKSAEATTEGSGSLLDSIISQGGMARDESQRAYARDLVGEFAKQVLSSEMTVSADTVGMINRRIAQIDELLSRQLNEVLHAEAFQKLEATWRGLHYLVSNSETGSQLKLRVLNVTKKELLKDIEKAPEFDQSQLFKKVYEDEYGMFGGSPYTALIGDYEFGRHPQDVELLKGISQVAAAAHAPFLSAVNPSMLDMGSFNELSNPRDLEKIFETAEMAKWRSFRESDESRYVALAMPHILMRLPYGPDTKPIEEFNFVEDVDGKDHGKYLWGNAAWALGARLTDSFAQYGWCAAIRGVEGGGSVENLPTHTFKTDEGDVALKCPTEIAITDRREKELDNLGFIALCHRKGTDKAAFFGGRTCQKPKAYDTPEANANARLSAQLPYILATSRFAHYLKAIMRDKIGAFMSRGDVESYLSRWIAQYVLLNDDAPHAMKAKYPLRDARIDVTDVAGKPGAYNAVVFLRPHFQLEELTASMRLVAQLPPPAGG